MSDRIAITRGVSDALADCELSHMQRTPVDPAVAREHHLAYEEALGEAGFNLRRIAGEPDLPDCVFIEDTAVVLPELALITRPGAASRRPETAAVEETLRGLRPLVRIEAPATLDGGDVLRLGDVLYVGVGYRSDEQAVDQLRNLLEPYGYRVVATPFSGCLHLKTAVTELADGLLLANPDYVDTGLFEAHRSLTVDPGEPFAGNIVRAGETLIYGDSHPRTLARIRAEGLEPQLVPDGELAKAEGGVTCCSLLLAP